MKRLILVALAAAVAAPIVSLLVAAKPAKAQQSERIARGKYLVNFGGCNDCHTPLKMTPTGPAPDMTRLLSGHPEGTQLPAPNLAPGPWFAATAGMTAWTGPWGITYAANLTPDTNTGLGIWTEEMFIKAMRTGRHMGSGRPILPPMPWQGVATLNDDDLKAVFAYLRNIPAIANHVPDPQPPAGQARLE